eukprot:CAMPEP_0171102496 /NCGR_PEP_ID=MMETSP0766_2-20121228/57994_1 /TAXON_ID=439317 /ORGANISM="Gambierdiscus australes, Strain CAWD 149" /LENGTH=40 /DNA_ID= /DNA_START= /DNA_END= /DNA_ORIENTATION=
MTTVHQRGERCRPPRSIGAGQFGPTEAAHGSRPVLKQRGC